jgi:small-conductance mechanosensitive channel
MPQLLFALASSDFLGDLGGNARHILTYQFVRIGTLSINLLFLIKAAIFVALLILLSRLLQKFIVGRLLSHIHIAEAQRFALGRFITYAFFLIGVFVGVQSLGVNLKSLVIFGGAVGVGVGLGLQNVVSNFVAGLILLIEQPIRIGDRIEIKDTMGDVIRIAARSTWVRTNDNVLIVVPNSDFINSAVINWTANDRTVRIQLPVGVSYSSDPEQVRAMLLKVAAENKNVLPEPKADVIFTDYGDNSINFSLRVWTDTQTQTPAVLKSDLYFAAFEVFRKAGIELPFPQRDLHIRSSDIALPYQPETPEPRDGD